MLLLWDILNLEDIDDGWGESTGVEGSSGDGEDSDESDTTGMIFFFMDLSFISGFFTFSLLLIFFFIALNNYKVKSFIYNFLHYLIIAW